MNITWQLFECWPLRVLLLGGAVLLIGRIWLASTRQPARRAMVGTATILAALAIVPLTLLPGWLPLKVAEPIPVVEATAESVPAPMAVPVEPVARATVASPRADVPNFVLVFVEDPGTAVESRPAPAVAESAPVVALPPEEAKAETASAVVPTWLLVAYVIIAGFLMLRLAIGHFGLARLWRTGRSAPAWTERVFRDLAATTCPRAALRVSDRIGGPVCFGVLRPRVLVPSKLIASGDVESLRAIFAHELGHLQRRDPLAGWLLGLARVVYFVWPWLAGLRREVRLAQEILSDVDAARRSSGPADYAELLIRMTRARPAPLGAAGVRGSSSDLYRRVTMLLRNTKPVEGRCPRRWAVAVGGGLTALAIAFAGLYVQPRDSVAAEQEKKEVEKKSDETKPAEKKEEPKPAAKPDALKALIEKLKKDVGDDPEAAKQLEALLKSLEAGKPANIPAPLFPQKPLPLPGFPPGGIVPPDFDKELQQMQEQMRKQMEAMMKQMNNGGFRGAILAPPPLMPFPGMPGSGGRLGIRVDRPTDVLASQLDLPNGQGLVCADVPAESTAGKIGLKPHDILLEVAGKQVSSNVADFVQALRDVKPDQAVDVVVMRKGKKETLKGVNLPEAKENAFGPPLAFPPFAPPTVPAVPPPFPGRGPAVGVVAGPGETVRVEQVNDAFTVFYSKDGVKVTVAGSKDGDKVKADSIEVEDNGKTTKAESIEKLPKEYQDLARNALKAIK